MFAMMSSNIPIKVTLNEALKLWCGLTRITATGGERNLYSKIWYLNDLRAWMPLVVSSGNLCALGAEINEICTFS